MLSSLIVLAAFGFLLIGMTGNEVGAQTAAERKAKADAAAAERKAKAEADKAARDAKKAQDKATKDAEKAIKDAQKAAKASAKAAAKIANAEKKLSEAQLMEHASILLEAANNDYGGHRGAALEKLSHAIKRTEYSVLNNGTDQQAAQQLRDQVLTDYVKKLSKDMPKVHEPQYLSDAQVNLALLLLLQVRPFLQEPNQSATLDNVNAAIH